jgi:benzoyl-CoA-dihydrodiol lyase
MITFETRPELYRHWKLSFDGPVATLSMDVREDAGLEPDYKLKLNSYDLGVDIELADALQRIRFEHPEVHAVVITSLKERVFCAGANIMMLRGSSHGSKVNFCKFTNETRLAIEDSSDHSGLRVLAALNGICAGGGYELALACDEIYLVDDGNSAVSLPEAPLLGVLPGTGGLTRVVDKRHVRRDLADFFSTLVEGIKGKRAVEWKLVDRVFPTSQFKQAVAARARELAASSDRPSHGPGIALNPLNPTVSATEIKYSSVTLTLHPDKRTAELTVFAPGAAPSGTAGARGAPGGAASGVSGTDALTPREIFAAGDQFWPLRAFRELDDALLRLRVNELEIGTVVVRTKGDRDRVLAIDRALVEHQDDWLVREIVLFMKRTLKRLDLTARTFFAFIEPGSAFAGSLFELALASDRSYMLHDDNEENVIALSPMNAGPLRMSNGLTRLETRFLNDPDVVRGLLAHDGPFNAGEAEAAGLVTFAPDEIDWDDEVRVAVEARAAFSPDAMTGLEANLRFAGPETMETKIFGRLTAWQNWIFQRPNAVGEKGALKVYGQQGRPEFDWKRT